MGRTLKLFGISLILIILLLSSCNNANKENTGPAVEEVVENSYEVSTEESTEEVSEDKPVEKKRSRPVEFPHEYVPGGDGFFNLDGSVAEVDLASQYGGTCWLHAAVCSMDTAYQIETGNMISLDPLSLLDEIYSDDKEEGVMISHGTNKNTLGGMGYFVVNELSRGFGDGLVLDRGIDAKGWTADEIKEGIKKYGGLYIGIPDTNPLYQGSFDNYYTMNFLEPDEDDFDHSIAVIGWDDDFPREYFKKEPSQDGAWITYNSSYPVGYYFVSYDTPFDQLYDTPVFMSVSDRYTDVLSYDCGCWFGSSVKNEGGTTVANVFNKKGNLAAVGTYSLEKDQDLTIEILTSDLEQSLYSQKCHIEDPGYHVIDLDSPLEVEDYAIAITYPAGAPVEGESMELDSSISIKTSSDKGQSFILLDGEWLDMSEGSTSDKVGRVTNNCCIKALYR